MRRLTRAALLLLLLATNAFALEGVNLNNKQTVDLDAPIMAVGQAAVLHEAASDRERWVEIVRIRPLASRSAEPNRAQVTAVDPVDFSFFDLLVSLQPIEGSE
jgi:hypothetical protein